jgi:hypothetical protein
MKEKIRKFKSEDEEMFLAERIQQELKSPGSRQSKA